MRLCCWSRCFGCCCCCSIQNLTSELEVRYIEMKKAKFESRENYSRSSFISLPSLYPSILPFFPFPPFSPRTASSCFVPLLSLLVSFGLVNSPSHILSHPSRCLLLQMSYASLLTQLKLYLTFQHLSSFILIALNKQMKEMDCRRLELQCTAHWRNVAFGWKWKWKEKGNLYSS